jgi:acyl carrier protein
MNTSTPIQPSALAADGAPNPAPLSVEDLIDWLTERVSVYLQRAPEEIDPGEPLAEYGLDSVAALSLCGDVEEDFDLILDPTVAWDYPTIAAFAAHLLEEMAGGKGGA